MDLPLCKICGERHRLGFCPKFGNPASERRRWLRGMTGPASKAASVVTAAPMRSAPVKEIPDETQAASAPQTEPHHQAQAPQEEAPPQVIPEGREAKPRFDKRAYQRELMRTRRAKAKAAVP